MKKIYTANNKFMLRHPLACNETISFTEDKIKELCKDVSFREKIRIASMPLLKMMDEYLEDSSRWKEKTKLSFYSSIFKYYIRSVKRATPFGLFSAVGIGEFEKADTFDDRSCVYKKHLSVDCEWLFGLIEECEKKYYQKLFFQLNSIVKSDGNRVKLIYTDKEGIEEISVRRTKVFDIVSKMAAEAISFHELMEEIQQEYKDVDEEIIVDYLVELINKNILISTLRPPFTEENMLRYFIEKCQEFDLPETDVLQEMNAICEQFLESDYEEGGHLYQQLVEKMKTLYTCKNYLQIDTVMEQARYALSKENKEKLEEVVSYLVKFSELSPSNNALKQYREKFLDRYGFNRFVPVLEMMEPIIGIGVPNGYMNPINEYYVEPGEKESLDLKLQNYIANKIECALLNKEPVVFRKEEWDCYIKEGEAEKLPVSFETYFGIENQQFVLSNIIGSNGVGKSFGRFSMHDRAIKNTLFELNQREKTRRPENVEMCEVSYLPKDRRTGNITRCLSGRNRIVTGYSNIGAEFEEIMLEDILIGATQDRFFAVDRKTGKEIIFGANNMFNILMQPNVFRFLLEIENDGRIIWNNFPWFFRTNDMCHIPQIQFEDVILSREKWRVSYEDLCVGKNVSFEEFEDVFERYRMKCGMPTTIYISDLDNVIFLDLEQVYGLRILYEELKKKKGSNVIIERASKQEMGPVYESGNEFITEIVVPFFKKGQEKPAVIHEEKEPIGFQNHLVYPYDNWLYYKIYCSQEREIELIALNLREFGMELQKQYGIDHFFIRYMDPKPHVRVRFHGMREQLMNATLRINQWLAEQVNNNIAGDFCLSVYDREIERYGGEQLMIYAEKLFRVDSQIVEELLYLLRVGNLEVEKEEIVLLSILLYVQGFFGSFDEQIGFLESQYRTNEFSDEIKKNKNKYIDLFDVENDYNQYRSNDERNGIYCLLEARREIVECYKQKIDEVIKDEDMRLYIISSVIHLHCNRFLGTDRVTENKLMEYADAIMYAKKCHFGKGKNDGE